MTRKLATIEVIKDLNPIPNADKILKATVKGWECVVSINDNLNVGDKVIYIEIDSVLPKREEFAFMEKRNYRVKTIKLRGQVSQGLILPMKFLGGDHEVGEDVTELLGIKKYDPQADAESKLKGNKKPKNKLISWLFRFPWFRELYRKFDKSNEPFPTGIVSKTDEERIQNLPNDFTDWSYRRVPFYATEKIDGQSGTYFLDGKTFGVCSRNIWLRKKDNSSYWCIANKYSLEDVLKKIKEKFSAERVVIQGEIVGEGIQGNKYNIKGYDFYVFNIIVDGIKVDQLKLQVLCVEFGLKNVPMVYKDYQLPATIQELVEVSKGNSKLLKSQGREGLVFRNYNEDISFKVINPNFLLRNE